MSFRSFTDCSLMIYATKHLIQMIKAIAGTEFYNSASAQMWDHLNAIIVVNALINPFLYGVYYCSFDWRECCQDVEKD